MEIYQNLNGNSGVVGYEIGDDFIIVHFRNGKWLHYLYNCQIIGAVALEHMKSLAKAGAGLNSYISTTIKKRYADKW